MKRTSERRRHPREVLSKPELGIAYPRHKEGDKAADNSETLLLYVLNRSKGGVLLESPKALKASSLLDMRIQLPHEKVWMAYTGEVVWNKISPTKPGYHVLGIQSSRATLPEEVPMTGRHEARKRMYPSDLEFLMATRMFDAISEQAECPLLNVMIPMHIKAGERIISQGEIGESLYIIQEGLCVVNVEKEGVHHPIARLRAGDIVGEMAILTGERRVAHVDAETDMKLWNVSRTDFDRLCEECPDLANFLSELVTHRFTTERITVDRMISKYVINEIISRGGWSIVYRGIHTNLNMTVAIKMLKHDMAMDSDFSDKFRDEAKTIARLNHENIVKIYDIEELYRTIFIIMEYLEGMPLDCILERVQRLPLYRTVDILLQVCAGLAYAHDHGIVHQDIKPANIYVQPDDRIKILDFGLACQPGSVDCGLRGTIFYAPPEAIEGEPVDERADIYSLGITAYEMVTGQRPFPESDINKMIELRLREDIPDPRTLTPNLPNEFNNFLVRATQRDPASRYKSVWQIIHDLRPLADRLGISSEPTTGKPQKMMSLFLFYQEEHQLLLNRMVEQFGHELEQMGAVLRAADFKDV